MLTVRQALDAVLRGRSLDAAAAESVFAEILDDLVADPLVAALLIALRMKRESAAELTGATRAMLQRARPLDLGPVLDTAGTGGDGAGTFNISTGAALVAAAAGIPTAKHGNRAVSGRVGAADVLEHFGVNLELEPPALRRCLTEAGICFVFAPAYHPVLARLAVLRRTLAVRTIFNLMAPLANPARPRFQLLGVAEPILLDPLAEALAALGVHHALVVHGHDGLDEISLAAPSSVIEITNGAVRRFEITPRAFGIREADPAALLTADAKEAVQILRAALAGDPGPARDILALNGGAAIYAGGGAPTLADGVRRAQEILAAGRPLATIERLRAASRHEVP